jgi:hypothetical protein
MGAHPILLKTRKKEWGNGSTLTFHPAEISPGFRGPRGGRLVADYFILGVDVADYDVVTQSVLGEDMWRWINRVVVRQQGGRERVNLKGDELRIYNYLVGGPGWVHEYADQGADTGIEAEFFFPVPMSKPWSLRPRDFAMPLDTLSAIEITCATETELAGSGGTVDIVDASYYVIAVCHEEHALEFKAEDMVRASVFGSTDSENLHIDTGRLQDLALFKQGFSGGTDLDDAASVRIPGLMPEPFEFEQLKQIHRQRRYSVSNSGGTQGSPITVDPFTLGTAKAIPILAAGDNNRGASVLDSPEAQWITVHLTGNTEASLLGITRIVKPKDNALLAAIQARYGVSRATFKTAGKTRRGGQAWGPSEAAYMPQSAPLPMDRG